MGRALVEITSIGYNLHYISLAGIYTHMGVDAPYYN